MPITLRKPTLLEKAVIADQYAVSEEPNGNPARLNRVRLKVFEAFKAAKIVVYEFDDGATMTKAEVPGFGAMTSFSNPKGLWTMKVPPGQGQKVSK